MAWQGNPKHRFDRHRSFPLHWFHDLAMTEGVELYSLQKGPGSEDLKAARFPIVDLGSKLDEGGDAFAETAAVIAALDLVITCDSALAHLAGALGVRVWVALSVSADWRWLLDRGDTPWYPSMRLFRWTVTSTSVRAASTKSK
jgi:Glycosyltransferase family 9 (heptosyltransferase)